MRVRLSLVCVVLSILILVCGCGENGTPIFSVPEGVTYESKAAPESHSFHWGEGNDTVVFVVSPHPAGLSEAMVRRMADETASLVEPELRALDEVESVAKTSSDISVGRFTGREVDFLLTGEDGKTFHQCVYVLWDGERVWQGQLSGSEDSDLAMVRRILASRTN